MRKIPMLFTIHFDDNGDRVVTDIIAPHSEVLFDPANEVIATRKFDGTATKLIDGVWLARRSVKPGKTAPAGYIEEQLDTITGRSFGWEPMESSPFAKMFRQVDTSGLTDGTYELIGPKINGNKEHADSVRLVRHGATPAPGFPSIADMCAHRDNLFAFLEPFFADMRSQDIEGVVFWVNGSPAVKLRVVDFFPELSAR